MTKLLAGIVMATAHVLTRAQFNHASRSLVLKTQHSAEGWQWHEHSTVPELGYLSRVAAATRKSPAHPPFHISDIEPDQDLLEDDISTFQPHTSERQSLIVHQYIVYSPTFQVPAFYFQVHDGEGSSLSLQDIIQSTLFHAHALPQNLQIEPHSISPPASAFPLLSQGDHPVLGTPCWYFHPCQTSTAVNEILRETPPQQDETADEKLLRWLQVWFLVLRTVVDLR